MSAGPLCGSGFSFTPLHFSAEVCLCPDPHCLPPAVHHSRGERRAVKGGQDAQTNSTCLNLGHPYTVCEVQEVLQGCHSLSLTAGPPPCRSEPGRAERSQSRTLCRTGPQCWSSPGRATSSACPQTCLPPRSAGTSCSDPLALILPQESPRQKLTPAMTCLQNLSVTQQLPSAPSLLCSCCSVARMR